MGKAALFSDPAADAPATPSALSSDDHAVHSGAHRPGTVVVECGSCDASTRVSYIDFVIDSLPFTVWLPPLPALRFNRKMTCPACGEFTWVRAHWLG